MPIGWADFSFSSSDSTVQAESARFQAGTCMDWGAVAADLPRAQRQKISPVKADLPKNIP